MASDLKNGMNWMEWHLFRYLFKPVCKITEFKCAICNMRRETWGMQHMTCIRSPIKKRRGILGKRTGALLMRFCARFSLFVTFILGTSHNIVWLWDELCIYGSRKRIRISCSRFPITLSRFSFVRMSWQTHVLSPINTTSFKDYKWIK